MLQQVMEYIHNYFIKTGIKGTHEIKNGMLSLSLLDGQRFWIVGSVFNDGVYTYHPYGITDDDDKNAVGFQDESFDGAICALAVPPNVIALSEEISKWVEKYGDAVNSPFQSENVIGVYSYEKMMDSRVNGNNPIISWQTVFKDQLNRWRKVSL